MENLGLGSQIQKVTSDAYTLFYNADSTLSVSIVQRVIDIQ